MSFKKILLKGSILLLLGVVFSPSLQLLVIVPHAYADLMPGDPGYIPGGGTGGGSTGGGGATDPMKIPNNSGGVPLIQPLDGSTTKLSSTGFSIIIDYFNISWPWIIGLAGGISVLQVLIGGAEMMMSVGQSREDGKSRLQWAIAGMLMVALAGTILNLINPSFFTLG